MIRHQTMYSNRSYRIASYLTALSSYYSDRGAMEILNNAAKEVGSDLNKISDKDIEEGLMKMVEKMSLVRKH